MTTKAPGKSNRKGISLIELTELFPVEEMAVKWFEAIRWPEERSCGHCGSTETREVPGAKRIPYWCKDCRSYFSVRTGTSMERSKVSMRKWAFATNLYVTHLQGVSSMKLHQYLGVTQKTALFMLHRLRDAWNEAGLDQFAGPVEADETYFGGKRKNMPKSTRKHLTGRGPMDKDAVVGMKDRTTKRVRAEATRYTDKETLQSFVVENTADDAMV